ncbi:MAG TPA: ABC transporter permease [Acidimicrobiales bacterium]|nr:ABC transporter permease [Acidimicrobiales bacterium]
MTLLRSDLRDTALPSPAHLLRRQIRYELRAHWRSRSLVALELALPLALLLIMGSLLRNAPGGPLGDRYPDVFVPNMVALGLVTTCFAGLGIEAAYLRLTGAGKRLRGTPLPGWVPLTALVAQSLVVGTLAAVLLALAGALVLGVALPAAAPFLVATAVGGTSFAALGVLVSTLVPRVESAPAVTNLVLWPLAVLSGVFTAVPTGSLMYRIAMVLPLRHLMDAMNDAFGGRGFEWGGLAVVAAWGVGAATLTAARRPGRT